MPGKNPSGKWKPAAGEQSRKVAEQQAIMGGCGYSLTAFSKASGLGKNALRSARRQGLPVHYHGNAGFILADEFLEWLAKRPTTASSAVRYDR